MLVITPTQSRHFPSKVQWDFVNERSYLDISSCSPHFRRKHVSNKSVLKSVTGYGLLHEGDTMIYLFTSALKKVSEEIITGN